MMPTPATLIFVLVIAIAGLPRTAHAQQLVGYGIGGFGGYTGWFGSGNGFHASGGGEFLIKGIAGGGGEYGLFGNTSSALTVLSFNGVLYPLRHDGPVSPFVTGGYSRFSSGEGDFDAYNIGAGVNFWQNDHVGVRAEFRDHVRRDTRGTVHYYSVRTGVVFK